MWVIKFDPIKKNKVTQSTGKTLVGNYRGCVGMTLIFSDFKIKGDSVDNLLAAKTGKTYKHTNTIQKTMTKHNAFFHLGQFHRTVRRLVFLHYDTAVDVMK